MRGFAELLEADLQALAEADRRRACPEVAGTSRIHLRIGNQPLTSFCTNDYLDLATHPHLRRRHPGGGAGWVGGFGFPPCLR